MGRSQPVLYFLEFIFKQVFITKHLFPINLQSLETLFDSKCMNTKLNNTVITTKWRLKNTHFCLLQSTMYVVYLKYLLVKVMGTSFYRNLLKVQTMIKKKLPPRVKHNELLTKKHINSFHVLAWKQIRIVS